MAGRERTLFVAGVVAAWLFFVYMAWHTPVQLDDWYEVAWHRKHALTPGTVLDFARYNYFNYNPRPGETLLLLVNGPRWVHLLLTPIAQLALLGVIYTLALGHLPRADRRTLAELLVVQALIWLVIPVAGEIYFYRPFTTNYLMASTAQLSVFVPFRLELARPTPGPTRWWHAPALFAWAVVGGGTNEHTGPTAIVIAAVLAYAAGRAGRRRGWMIAAAAGLAVGYALLYFAPGQSVRYISITTDISPLATLSRRSPAECVRLVGMVLAEVQVGALVVFGALLYARARGAALAALDRPRLLLAAVALASALMITVTTFASPIIEDRVMLAACLSLTIALGAAVPAIWSEPRARAALVAVAAIVVAYDAVGFAWIYRGLRAESDARLAALARARPGEIVHLAPSAWPSRDAWGFGEDLLDVSMREYVAHRVFDVGGIELDPEPAGVQPTPPEKMTATLSYDPPVDARAARPDWPLWQFVPTQWASVVRELRESLAYLEDVPGHRLRAIDVTVAPPSPALAPPSPTLASRPIYLVRWRDGRYEYVDIQDRVGDRGFRYESIVDHGLSITPVEAWLSACGRLHPVELQHVGGDLRVPVEYECRGNHTIYVCDAAACWLAGRYW